ncbi:HXXEE domain-containing protein [Candidatus Protochlamydia phocaeensis]|uniref:HXXEE domain-containing protein n=1 Tax=Candidatus Protochlamydia phocaeensis TaxID=1414722 RepID=UPI0008399484|nr:HXXEE domain-containing protein [Candidatus Protochlamydia phocaeensis]
MSHEYLLWLCLFAYAVHIFEEKALNWLYWSRNVLGLKTLTWADFYIANGVVIITGICAAMVGWVLPSFALIIPALQLINGVGFHILPTLVQRRFSPGIITAILLFLPISIWSFYGAYQDGILTVQATILSFIFAGLLMASPFIFMQIKDRLHIPSE